MSAMYDRHEVSVKVALYSSDGKRVMEARSARFGLLERRLKLLTSSRRVIGILC